MACQRLFRAIRAGPGGGRLQNPQDGEGCSVCRSLVSVDPWLESILEWGSLILPPMPQTTLHLSHPAPSHPRLWGLIPCAGNGSRSGASGPKQYQPIAGKPMVLHTLSAFAAVQRLAGTLVVVSAGDDFFDALPVQVAPCGGAGARAVAGTGNQAP